MVQTLVPPTSRHLLPVRESSAGAPRLQRPPSAGLRGPRPGRPSFSPARRFPADKLVKSSGKYVQTRRTAAKGTGTRRPRPPPHSGPGRAAPPPAGRTRQPRNSSPSGSPAGACPPCGRRILPPKHTPHALIHASGPPSGKPRGRGKVGSARRRAPGNRDGDGLASPSSRDASSEDDARAKRSARDHVTGCQKRGPPRARHRSRGTGRLAPAVTTPRPCDPNAAEAGNPTVPLETSWLVL